MKFRPCDMARMEASPKTKLNKQSILGYKSFGSSNQLADGSSPSDLTCDLTKNYGEELGGRVQTQRYSTSK